MTLRNLMRLDLERVPVRQDVLYPIVGVLNRGRGLLRRVPMSGSQTKYTTLNAVRPGQVVYSRLKAFEGSVTVATDLGEIAFASQEFPTFTCGPDLLPGYFRLITTTEPFWAALSLHSKGMGGRRERVSPDDFLDLTIPLPPRSAQERIVDLIGALDAQIEALIYEQKRVEEVLLRLLDFLWKAPLPDARMTLGQVADLGSGPSWSASDEVAAPVADATPVVKITNTRPDGTLDLADRLYVRGLPSSTRLLDDRSLIAIRTNGNRERIGNVYLPTDEVFGSAVSAFQFIVRAQSPDVRDYLYWALRAPCCQRMMSSAASGSTGLGNMGARWLRALELPWPEDPSRTEFVENAKAVGSFVTALASESESLRVVRAICLSELLTGAVGIPDTYDELLAEAV
jgi:type I restriction enzyme, S subunit